jgi:tetratricopeptide (TPR) repeat protein
VLAVSAFWRGTFVMLRDQGRSHWLGPQPDVRKVAVSPDGRFVASASWNGNGAGTIVRDAQTGRQVAVLPGGDTGQPAFSPDGKWLAAGRRPSRIWRVEGWQPGPELEGNSASTFTPDGALVEFGYEQFVRFRDPETGRALATFEDPDQDRTGSIAFTPDGSRMICIAPETGRLHVWDLRSIREQLAQLGLDWERPKEPPSTRSTDTPATPLRVRIDSPDKALLPSLARDNVRYGRWNAAARDFKALLEIQPGEITNWHDFVVLQLKLGNEHEYKVACKRLLERFSNATDWYTTNSAAWSLSLGPDAGVDPEQIVSLARRALKLKPDDYSATNTLGAALYRAGRYQEALETLERAIALHGGGGLGFDMLLMALVKQALGQADEAREWCKRGVRWTRDAETGKISDPAITLPLEWEAHLELEMLCREAQFAVGLLVPTLPRDAFAHD